ncbi:MAG: hypothetical protein Q7T63_20560 [Burkholderiaceae bacterium]|nr:hypothetical protein [Burkholderiaceae bacterium]MDO9088724.1 hypothetical protein [Burkholderiaceae bacterium]
MKRHGTPRLAGLWAWTLAVTLLYAQTLGLLHGLAHAALAQNVASVSMLAGSGPFQGHDSGSGDCRLFDQAAHGDALTSAAAPALPPAPPTFTSRFSWGERTVRHAAHFDARAPPARIG